MSDLKDKLQARQRQARFKTEKEPEPILLTNVVQDAPHNRGEIDVPVHLKEAALFDIHGHEVVRLQFQTIKTLMTGDTLTITWTVGT